MPSPKAIKLYLEAKDAYSHGDTEKAAQLLANALGSPEPSACMRENILSLLQSESLSNEAVLSVLATEVAKKEENHA